jgi:hypothetical protein
MSCQCAWKSFAMSVVCVSSLCLTSCSDDSEPSTSSDSSASPGVVQRSGVGQREKVDRNCDWKTLRETTEALGDTLRLCAFASDSSSNSTTKFSTRPDLIRITGRSRKLPTSTLRQKWDSHEPTPTWNLPFHRIQSCTVHNGCIVSGELARVSGADGARDVVREEPAAEMEWDRKRRLEDGHSG